MTVLMASDTAIVAGNVHRCTMLQLLEQRRPTKAPAAMPAVALTRSADRGMLRLAVHIRELVTILAPANCIGLSLTEVSNQYVA